MKKLISAVTKLSVATFFNIVVGIIRTKVFAVVLGTFGIGIISQLMNFYNLVVLVSSVGIPLGLTKYIAEWQNDDLWTEIKQIIGQSISLLLVMGIVFVSAILIFANKISSILFNDTSYGSLIIALSLSIPMTLIGAFFDSFIKALQRFKNFMYISLVTTSISLLITIGFTYYYNVFGAVLAIGISGVIYVLSYVIYFIRSKTLAFSDFFSFNFNYSPKFKGLIMLSIAYLFVGSIELLTQTVIRTLIITNLGISSNGIYQCVYSISMNYFSIIFMSLGMYLLPTLSAIKEIDIANIEINNTLRLTLVVIVPILTIIFTFREYIIIIFYSSQFLSSSDLMFYFFLGDYFKAISAVVGTWLVPALKIKLWIYISLTYYLLQTLLFVVLLNYFHLGLHSVIIAYLIANVVNTIVNLYFIGKYNKFRLSATNIKLIVLSLSFILTIFLTSLLGLSIAYYIIFPAMIIWVFISINKEERVTLTGIFKGFFIGTK